jgi:hypothetical protein
MTGKHRFEKKVVEEGWLAANNKTQEYYEENKDKLINTESLLKDLKD